MNKDVKCDYCGKVFWKRGLARHITHQKQFEEYLKDFRKENNILIRKYELRHLQKKI